MQPRDPQISLQDNMKPCYTIPFAPMASRNQSMEHTHGEAVEHEGENKVPHYHDLS